MTVQESEQQAPVLLNLDIFYFGFEHFRIKFGNSKDGCCCLFQSILLDTCSVYTFMSASNPPVWDSPVLALIQDADECYAIGEGRGEMDDD